MVNLGRILTKAGDTNSVSRCDKEIDELFPLSQQMDRLRQQLYHTSSLIIPLSVHRSEVGT